MSSNLEYYVRQAKSGDRQALETLVSQIQDKIYGLALRMLNNPQDAEDEGQEILIKVITHLSNFREESAFTSWVYRIACNHLLTKRKQKNDQMKMTFDLLAEVGFSQTEDHHALTISGPERGVLLEEVRMGCMQCMLSCLEKEMRIVFIFGEQYGVTSKEGAFILDITPEAFRKRLSRARTLMQTFMMNHCGLVDEKKPCRCHIKAAQLVKQDQIPSGKNSIVKKAGVEKSREKLELHLKELSEIDRTVAMYRNYPEYQSPDSFPTIVRDLIKSKQYSLFID